jgi:hypothetical protein
VLRNRHIYFSAEHHCGDRSKDSGVNASIVFTHHGFSSYAFFRSALRVRLDDEGLDPGKSKPIGHERLTRRPRRAGPAAAIAMGKMPNFSAARQSGISCGIPSPPCSGEETSRGK